jgi:hypothetical protein
VSPKFRKGIEKMKNWSKRTKIIVFSIIGVLIIAAIASTIAIVSANNKNKTEETSAPNNAEQQAEAKPEERVEDKEVKIFSGNQRPVAIMIDNNINAWPQSSINKAYLVYEIIVEGGETRLMALFKNTDADVLGPGRSSRHYFLDYAMENDAIYTHYGWSPKAKKDIEKYKINNINGITTSVFWRNQQRQAPHNAYTRVSALYQYAENAGYAVTSEQKSVLNYVSTEVNLEDGQTANTVSIPYSVGNTVKYEYNSELGKYVRYSKGTKQTDAETGEDITVKNIIITFAKNEPLANDKKGRQNLNNIGTLDGYYITNGKAIKITCEKIGRIEQTVYKDLNGNEIKVNDGNTFIQICPIDADVQIQ